MIATHFLRIAVVAALAVSAGPVAAAPSAADVAKGKQVFARCAMCHDVKPGVNRLGPSLAGVIGRRAGSAAGFAYSPAMKSWGKPWTAANLNAYLAAPAKTVPGNRMAFPGIAAAPDRAAVIAYMATLK